MVVLNCFFANVSCFMIFRRADKKSERFIGYMFAGMLMMIPFSFSVDFGARQLNIPSEPVIALLALLLYYALDIPAVVSGKLIRHPITLAALAYQGWMICMIPFSSDVPVSIKYVLVNTAHFWVFFFGFWFFVQIAGKNILAWMRCYSLLFLLIMVYTLVRHSAMQFRIDVTPILAQPFYSDHALISATAAFLIPFFFIKDRQRPLWNFYNAIFIILACLVIYFSYCRATSLSLLVGLIFYVLLKSFKNNFRLLLRGMLFFFLIFTVSVVLTIYKQRPTAIETKKINWKDQITSIANVTTDVSNLERINRYHCAIRMFRARPLIGFGPGTFQTAFLPYQHAEEMTRISVTTERLADGKAHPTGRGGGAHSEYLQALAEMGIPGFIAWLTLVFISLGYGLKLYYKKECTDQQTVLAVLVSLVAFFTHALINNFLHNEEISVLFWAALSGLVELDLDKKQSLPDRSP